MPRVLLAALAALCLATGAHAIANACENVTPNVGDFKTTTKYVGEFVTGARCGVGCGAHSRGPWIGSHVGS